MFVLGPAIHLVADARARHDQHADEDGERHEYTANVDDQAKDAARLSARIPNFREIKLQSSPGEQILLVFVEAREVTVLRPRNVVEHLTLVRHGCTEVIVLGHESVAADEDDLARWQRLIHEQCSERLKNGLLLRACESKRIQLLGHCIRFYNYVLQIIQSVTGISASVAGDRGVALLEVDINMATLH